MNQNLFFRKRPSLRRQNATPFWPPPLWLFGDASLTKRRIDQTAPYQKHHHWERVSTWRVTVSCSAPARCGTKAATTYWSRWSRVWVLQLRSIWWFLSAFRQSHLSNENSASTKCYRFFPKPYQANSNRINILLFLRSELKNIFNNEWHNIINSTLN